jgi:hypothetical protein
VLATVNRVHIEQGYAFVQAYVTRTLLCGFRCAHDRNPSISVQRRRVQNFVFVFCGVHYATSLPQQAAPKSRTTAARHALSLSCLQMIGGVAILLRSVVLEQLLSMKRQGSRARGLGGAHLRERSRDAIASIPRLLQSVQLATGPAAAHAARQLVSPMLPPLRVQRALQIYPRVFVSPRGELRGPAEVLRILRGASALSSQPSQQESQPPARTVSRYRRTRPSTVTAPSAAASSADQSASSRRASTATRGPAEHSTGSSTHQLPTLTDVAMTSIDKGALPAADISAGFLSCALLACIVCKAWMCDLCPTSNCKYV